MSDTPKGLNYEVYMGRRKELMAAVGEAITEWSRVEHEITSIFRVVTQMPAPMVAEIIKPIRAFSLILDLADGAIRSVHEEEDLTYWISLMDWVRELAADRNYLAHTPVVCHNLTDPNKDDWGLAIPKVGPPVVPSAMGKAASYQWTWRKYWNCNVTSRGQASY